MNDVRQVRLLSAAAVASAAILAAFLLGAPVAALAVMLGAGILAVWLATPRAPPPEPAPAVVETGLKPLPEAPALLEAIDEPLLLVRNRRVLFANAAARAVLGEHIQGVDVRLAIRHPAAAERLADRGPDEPLETVTKTELIGLGERDRRWEMATSLLADGSRLVRLTDRSEAHASEQMRVDFVANASHELRTPLATILGFLETLQDDEGAAADPKIRSRFVTIMFDEARRIRQLVDDLISLSRIEAERFSPPRESVALLPLIDEVRRHSSQLIEERRSTIVVDTQIEPLVLGDRTQLFQLLQNLVVNALKYGHPGEPVTVRFEDAGGEMMRIAVVDRGEGIAPEHIPRLTERFYRVDPGRSRAMGGTGLGLAIAKHIVGRHRGRLDIRSALGEGTEVIVYLPRLAEPLSPKSHEMVTETTPNSPNGAASPG